MHLTMFRDPIIAPMTALGKLEWGRSLQTSPSDQSTTYPALVGTMGGEAQMGGPWDVQALERGALRRGRRPVHGKPGR